MARLAFIQWYPNDWLADPSVRSCSVAARGLWIDILSLMHLSPRRGYLLAATGSPISPEQLARLTGCSADEVTRLLAELQSSGVYSCTEDGVLYSRRMVRDESKRQKCSEAGKKGGGNPTFKGHPKGVPKGDNKGASKPPETRDQILPPSEVTPDRPLKVVPDSPHHRSVAYWCDSWSRVHGSKYPFAKKDGVHVRDILRHLEGSEEKFRQVTDLYLADADPFVADKGHPLGLLASGLVKYTAQKAKPKTEYFDRKKYLEEIRDANAQ